MRTHPLAAVLVLASSSIGWQPSVHGHDGAPPAPAGPVMLMPLPVGFLPPGLAALAWAERLEMLRPGMGRTQVERLLGVCEREDPGPVGAGDVVKLIYQDPDRMALDALGPITMIGTRTTEVYIDLAGGGFQSYRRWFMHC